MGKRITLVLEHPRMDYVYKRNGNDALDFWASQEGKNYLNYFKGAGIDKKDIDVIYFYPLIPKPLKQRNGRVFSYEKLLANQTSPYMEKLEETIISNDPEIIITTGAMGNKYFTGKGAMKDVRGRPNYHTINGKEYTIFPMYGPTYMSINNNASNMFRADLGTLNKFLDKGQQAFEPEIGNYEYVNTLGRVKEIYNYLLTNKPVVAWDLETNTLEPNLKGSKVLVISMSWEIGQGVTIPVSHKESPFSKEDQETIMSYHKQLMADKEIIKVAHNGRFDIHFLMSTWGFKAFSNTQDTIVAYWLTVSQEVDDSFRLSDLSFYYTNMGDYDRPLEEFKVKYVKDYNDAEAERVKKEKAEQKEILKAYAKENKVTQAEAKTILGLETPVKNKLTNEIDGSNFNYEWIPMDMLAEYASGDTDVTLQIYIALMKQVNEDARWVYLMTDFYPRLIVSLATMQHNGLAVDRNYLKQSLNKYEEDKEYYINIIQENPSVQEVVNEWQDLYEMGLEEYTKPVKERDKDIADLKNKYKKKLDEGFKPSSAKDKQWLLYKVIGVRPPLEKDYLTTSAQSKNFDKEAPTWEDFKTNKETIEWVADNHPEHAEVCNSLLGYIKANTISNTFIKSFLDRINRETSDGLIHGTFNPVGTATGRLSSSQPK